MNVLLIGGTRFIGRAIVEQLLRSRHTVTVYHRGQHEVELSGPVSHVHGDRRDYSRFQADLARLSPEAVVDVIPMNAEDTRAVVEALRGRIAASVHISSGDVYAPGQPIPIPEDAPTGPAEPVEAAVGRSDHILQQSGRRGGYPRGRGGQRLSGYYRAAARRLRPRRSPGA